MTQACVLAVPWKNVSNIIKILLLLPYLLPVVEYGDTPCQKKKKKDQNNLGFALK